MPLERVCYAAAGSSTATGTTDAVEDPLQLLEADFRAVLTLAASIS
jgi:hypothetical protein